MSERGFITPYDRLNLRERAVATYKPKEKPHDLANRAAHQTGEEATMRTLTTSLAAICFLLAFTFLRGTEQLLVASVGGLLSGGSR